MCRKKAQNQMMKTSIDDDFAISAENKLRMLHRTFCPVPFPNISRPLKFDLMNFENEALLRCLGLWDFAWLPLDRRLRPDLLAELMANYNPDHGCSHVKGEHIPLGPAELARALHLPARMSTRNAAAAVKSLGDGEKLASAIDCFLSSYVLFQEEEDDVRALAPEVSAVKRLAREGKLHEIDWAEIMWRSVEREMLNGPASGRYYYASHLQHLMKRTKPWLFVEEICSNKARTFNPDQFRCSKRRKIKQIEDIDDSESVNQCGSPRDQSKRMKKDAADLTKEDHCCPKGKLQLQQSRAMLRRKDQVIKSLRDRLDQVQYERKLDIINVELKLYSKSFLTTGDDEEAKAKREQLQRRKRQLIQLRMIQLRRKASKQKA